MKVIEQKRVVKSHKGKSTCRISNKNKVKETKLTKKIINHLIFLYHKLC